MKNSIDDTATDEPMTTLDLGAPTLAAGRISIVASAGTGKTHSLTVLVARHVAELGLRPDQLLLVTFTNEATRELIQRTRDCCQDALDAVTGVRPPGPAASHWLAPMMADGMRELAATRLAEFLARFDEVTICTIHSFCHGVLRRAGLTARIATDGTVETDLEQIIDEVITDLLAGRLADRPGALWAVDGSATGTDAVKKTLGKIKDAVRTALDNDGAVLLPRPNDEDLSTDPAMVDSGAREALRLAGSIRECVELVLDELHRRTAESGVITHNDMVRVVAEALDPTSGDPGALDGARALATDLAEQHRLIMVDEFQDTDGAQWRVFDAIHRAGEPECTLVMVGDPKQAIYRFRGADIDVYLEAAATADSHFKLDTNYRSDAPLLDGLETLLTGKSFDDAGKVVFEPVLADPRRAASALRPRNGASETDPLIGSPLEIRFVGNEPLLGGSGVESTKDGDRNDVQATVKLFLADMARHVRELLEHGSLATTSDRESEDQHTRVHDDAGDESSATVRDICARDIAVLVNGHTDAAAAVEALRHAGVPAVRLRTGNVFRSEAARHWMMMLAGLARPGARSNLRSFALSWFGGLDENDLLLADRETPATGDPQHREILEAKERLLHCERRCLEANVAMRREGVTGAYLAFRNEESFLRRVLGSGTGDRDITDLDHIAEHLAALPRFARGAGANDVLAELTALVEGANNNTEAQQRRIDSDADAVTVLTIHASKGLQFPVVFLPTLVRGRSTRGAHPRTFPLRVAGRRTRRALDLASAFDAAKNWPFTPRGATLTGPSIDTAKGREDRAKNDATHDFHRQLYVALTRAQHKLICYWSPTKRGSSLPFEECLGRAVGDRLPLTTAKLIPLLQTLETRSNGALRAIVLDPSRGPTPTIAGPPPSRPVVGSPATFVRDGRSITVVGHGRWSYSSIVNALDDGHLDIRRHRITVEFPGSVDERNLQPNDTPDDRPRDRERTAEFPWATLPAGPSIGTLVHSVLDHVDPGAPTIEDDLRASIARYGAGWHGLDVDRLHRALLRNIDAPLGAAMGHSTLRRLGAADRLSELKFDFPLPQERGVTVATMAALLAEHVESASRLGVYAADLGRRAVDGLSFAGYMNGSIDAVFRVTGGTEDVDTRYFVSDYKTNRLHGDFDLDPFAAYDHRRLEDAVCRSDYVIQMLVYSVALHRYLRWRLPDYDIDRHFGGVAYLFLRGMDVDPASPDQPPGVFHWRPATPLIEGLDGLFAGNGVLT